MKTVSYKESGLVAKSLPPLLINKVMRPLNQAGYQIFAVGGGVRDALLKRPVKDWDFATNASPDEVMRLFPRSYPTGIEHGTVTVSVSDQQAVEITTFRVDESYEDKRHPKSVRFVDSIEEDLSRRDFTINALAFNPWRREIIDPWHGLKDLRRRSVRTVGKGDARFAEDALRLMRAARFAAQLNFTIAPETLSAMRRNALGIQYISKERIHAELLAMLAATKPSVGLKPLYACGILQQVLPELSGYPSIRRLFAAVDRLAKKNLDPLLRLAVLLHPLDKSTLASVLKRLRFSSAHRLRVCHLLSCYVLDYRPLWTDGELRQWIAQGAPEQVDDLFLLQETIGLTQTPGRVPKKLLSLKRRVKSLVKQQTVFGVGDLAIDGTDIMSICQTGEGAHVGRVLEEMLQLVFDNPQLNSREALRQIVVERFRSDLYAAHGA